MVTFRSCLVVATICAAASFSRADQPTWLVSSIQTDALKRYDLSGAYLGDFIAGAPLDAPQHGCIDPTGTTLYVPQANGGTSVQCYDLATGALINHIQHPAFTGLTAVTFSPDGFLVISDFSGGRIYKWDVETDSFAGLAVASGHFVTPHEVLYLDDRILVTDWQGGAIVEFTLAGTFTRILNSGPHVVGPLGIIESTDGASVHVVNNFTTDVATFRLSDGLWTGNLVAPDSGMAWPEGIERAPDGSIVVTSPGDNRIYRFDGTTGEALGTFETGHGAAGTVDVMLVPARCPADTDNDQSVDLDDVLNVLSTWGPCPYCATDVTHDGTIGFADLLTIVAAWGACPT